MHVGVGREVWEWDVRCGRGGGSVAGRMHFASRCFLAQEPRASTSTASGSSELASVTEVYPGPYKGPGGKGLPYGVVNPPPPAVTPTVYYGKVCGKLCGKGYRKGVGPY